MIEDEVSQQYNVIATLIHESHMNAVAHGFWNVDTKNSPFHIPTLLMLIVSEIGEAMEADRKELQAEHIEGFTGLEEELADAVIRIFDMAGGYHLDLAGAIQAKMAYNVGRPYKHDKNY